MFYPGFGFGLPVGRFEQDYHVYPVSFLDKGHLENGDKVIMPPSALDRLASLHIDYPMLFEVTNTATNRRTHCGVLEFVAEEGCVYMPYWMMQNLLVQEGDLIRMSNATLQKGTYVKLQPHTKDFLDISNPKAVLETTLRNFSCLTTGDNIMVAYNNKKYYIDIVETRPDRAITIIETDCEVDFAPPLDYVEPPRPTPVAASAAAPSTSAGGAPKASLGPSKPQFRGAAAAKKKAEEEAPKEEEPPAPTFLAFQGSGRRLDGKSAPGPSGSSASATPSGSSSQSAAAAAAAARAAPGPSSGAGQGSSAAGGRAAGKLVFGAGGAAAAPGSKEVPGKQKQEDKEAKEETSKFQAFTGKGYSLK